MKYAVLNKNICHFLDRDWASFLKKNPKHRNIYKTIQCCALDFFPQNTLGEGPAFWIFIPRIRVKAPKVLVFGNLPWGGSLPKANAIFPLICKSFSLLNASISVSIMKHLILNNASSFVLVESFSRKFATVIMFFKQLEGKSPGWLWRFILKSAFFKIS